jgi:pyruvyltransferase
MKNISIKWTPMPDNAKFTNYGDILTPFILKRFNINAIHEIHNPQLYGIGSLLHMCPDDFQGNIWSSGYLYPTKFLQLKENPICVRGKLSLQQFKNDTSNTFIGDGGLLLEKIYKPNSKKIYKLGIFPNYCDLSNMEDDPISNFKVMKQYPEDVLLIDPRDYIETVINNINSCENIITSSLHGLITCDTYDIPHALFRSRETDLAIHHLQGSFKFHDYYSTFDLPFSVDQNTFYLNKDTSFEYCLSKCKIVNKPSLENIKHNLVKSVDKLYEL